MNRLRVTRHGAGKSAEEEIEIETPAGRILIQQDEWETAILRYPPGSNEPECPALWGEPDEDEE